MSKWQERFHSKKLVTLVLQHILMLVKPLLQSVFCSTQVYFIKWVKFMKVEQQWTGWHRKKKEVLQLLLLLQLAIGKTIVLTLLIHQATWISQLKQNALLKYLMVLLLYYPQKAVLNLNLKQFGVKLKDIMYLVWYTLIKWISSVLIIIMFSK